MPFAPQWLSLIQPVHVLSAAFVERPIVHNSTASMPTMLRALFMFASSSSGFTGRKPGIRLGWRLALLLCLYPGCHSLGWVFFEGTTSFFRQNHLTLYSKRTGATSKLSRGYGLYEVLRGGADKDLRSGGLGLAASGLER